tara:strand:- start:262 stop:486 length:225 start_codon:yes stop_codon:yes gene_type:complete
MEWDILSLVFYLLLIDSLFVIVLAFSGANDLWEKKMGKIAKHFPLTKGWAIVYNLLVLLIGYALSAAGVLLKFW